jgi:hypothetical protein
LLVTANVFFLFADYFHPEDEGDTFFRSVGSESHTVLNPRRRHSAKAKHLAWADVKLCHSLPQHCRDGRCHSLCLEKFLCHSLVGFSQYLRCAVAKDILLLPGIEIRTPSRRLSLYRLSYCGSCFCLVKQKLVGMLSVPPT